MYSRYYKRWLDFVAACVLLPVLLPFICVIGLAGCAVHRGEAIFRQERVGRYGKEFRMLKFRTMNDGRGMNGELLSDAERISPFGQFLRRYSLDELPQILHVITGEMSFVGPRPLLPDHVADCTPQEFRRHDIRPGITGLAQVKGRDAIPFKSRFRYDVWYVNRTSIGLDFRILWSTGRVVFRKNKRTL